MRKVCSRCKKELPIDNFNKCKSTKDGFQYYCKSCQIEYRKNPMSIAIPHQDAQKDQVS